MHNIRRHACVVMVVGLVAVVPALRSPSLGAAEENPGVLQKAACTQSALRQTQAMIRTILDDMTKTYTRVGGGGITRIEQKATRIYVIAIAQEERVDEIAYELNVDSACRVTVVRRTPAS